MNSLCGLKSVFFAISIAYAGPLAAAMQSHDSHPSSLVDVHVPNLREGLPFRGATVPFGMVMFGPNDGAGYSLFTLQGAEVGDRFIGYVPFRPTCLQLEKAGEAGTVPNRNPKGAPGYFHDVLPEGIQVELTATERTGMARFNFPADGDRCIWIGATKLDTTPGLKGIGGYHDKGLGYKVYFFAELDHKIAAVKGAAVGFGKGCRTLLMKVGMSYVSVENAAANLKAENPGWDFEATCRKATQAWDRALSRIQVEGGTREGKALFATCLYRTYLQPNLFSDANGEFMGFDHRDHRVAKGARYANYSVWDTYRAWVQLMALLEPKTVSDMMQTLVDAAKHGGGAMPRWPTANVETGIMEEASATALVASAYAFGARDFDLESAWQAMNEVEGRPGTKCQTTEAHPSLELFLKHGYMPQGDDYNRKRAASFTLEYGMAALALSEFSKALGKDEAAARYLKRSQAWRNLFNPESGYIQSREADGAWFPKDFDPAKGHFIGFTEGNSAQYTWTVRHDMRALIEKIGGRDMARRRLDAFFKELNAGPDKPFCWIGNEPSLTIPWAYHWCGVPWRTQEVVDRILDEVWAPGSIPGADDLGTLSAWFVWASIGLFPAIPGTDVLLLSAPRFDKVVVRVPGGKTLTILAPGRNKGRRYVRGVSWNGKPLAASWLHAGMLMSGGTLAFTLSDVPDKAWASRPEDEPPSFDAPPPP